MFTFHQNPNYKTTKWNCFLSNYLSAIFTLLNVHTCDVQGHMIKIEAFTVDDS